MKRLIALILFSLGILGYIAPFTDFLPSAEARDFIKFFDIDVIPYSGSPIPKYKSFDSDDDFKSFGSWDIVLGEEVSPGEYLIEDMYGNYLRARIILNKSGLSGYSGNL